MAPYAPRLLRISGSNGLTDELTGTFLSADISGFTRVSEQLEGFGREGAEIMGVALDAHFGELVAALEARGGDVLFFGGDALFAWFTGPNHAWRGARSAVELQELIRSAPPLAVPGGSVRLRMSIGIHSGSASPVIGGSRHAAFFLVGPTVDRVLALEGAAGPGQIFTSRATASALDPRATARRGSFLILTARVDEPPEPPRAARETRVAVRYIPPALRPLLADGRAPGEHRLITVAFARLGGLARLTRAERVDRVRNWCSDLDDVTRTTGTTLLATDVRRGAAKATLVAGIPSLSDRDEERAVAAAHELVSRDRSIAVGVNTGAAFVGDVGSGARRTYMILGDSVNTAARAMGAARLGEILVTDNVARTVRARIVGRRRRVRAKGKRAPLVLVPVAGVVAAREESTAPPLSGRAREVRVLNEALSADRGVLVEVVGEGGLGRTRLLDEAGAASRRAPIVGISVPATVGNASFAPLHVAMRTLIGAPRAADLRPIARRLPHDLTRQITLLRPVLGFPDSSDTPSPSPSVVLRMRAEMLAALAGTVPGALLVDDSDALDPASQALLRELAPRLVARGWVVITTRRPTSRALASTGRTLRLSPLSSTAIRRIVLATIGAPVSERRLRQVVARANGNPLFAIELAQTAASGLLTELPRSAERIAGSLVDTLSPPDRALLRSLAVLGDEVDLAVLAHVAEDASLLGPDRWQPLRRFVSLVDDGHVAFVSETIRLAAYQGLPFHDRRRLHSRAVTALEAKRRAGDPVSAAAIARHAERAGLPDVAVTWATVAARDAESAHAPEDVASMWALALDASRAGSYSAQVVRELEESYGDATEILDEAAEARAAYRRAARGAEPVDVARLAWKRGRVDLREGELHAASLAAAKGLQALRHSNKAQVHPLAVRLLLLRAAAHCFSDRRDPSLRDGLHAMSLARELGDDELVADAAVHLQMEYGERGDPQQEAYGLLAVELLEPRGPSLELGSVLASLGLDRMFAGDWEAAVALYDRAARSFDLSGRVVGRLATEINRLSIVVEQGHLDAALESIEDLRPAATSAPPWFGEFLLATRGRAVAFKGDPDSGARTIRAALRSMRTDAPERIVADTECYLLEALVLAGRSAAARQLARRLIPTLDRLAPEQVVTITARRLLAIAACQRGGDPGADLGDALDLARRVGADIEIARILDIQVALRRAQNRPVPRAWLAERRRILRSHAIVFEPTYPLERVERARAHNVSRGCD